MVKHQRWCSRAEWKRILPHQRGNLKVVLSRIKSEQIDKYARYVNDAFESEMYGNGSVITAFKSEKWLRWLISQNFDVSREVFYEYWPDGEQFLFWQSPDDKMLKQLQEEEVLPKDYGK